MKRKTTSVELREFLRIAYCGLVLRGWDNERSGKDPILQEVWRLGKRINSDARRAARRSGKKKPKTKSPSKSRSPNV